MPILVKARHTYPMHPQVQLRRPGSCSVCGMAMEPLAPTAGDQDSAELQYLAVRFQINLVLTIPLLLMGLMRERIPGNPPLKGHGIA